jgi:hypothetical protein
MFIVIICLINYNVCIYLQLLNSRYIHIGIIHIGRTKENMRK